MAKIIPEFTGNLRSHMLNVPQNIYSCSGIRIFGKRIKSIVFTTDIAIIRNVNADAIIAVYPFTPQPIISHALITASGLPVFCGIGGGTTGGARVIQLATDAEFQGATGVVVNAPTKNEIIRGIREVVDIPVIVTVVSEFDDIDKRIESGTSIFNISAASRTPWLVESVRKKYPDFPIIATGGPTEQSITDTVNAGANAITWTPPSTAELFTEMMKKYRDNR